MVGLLGLAMGLGTGHEDISWPDSGSEDGSLIRGPGASLELEYPLLSIVSDT